MRSVGVALRESVGEARGGDAETVGERLQLAVALF
jgi:hypothetical protein